MVSSDSDHIPGPAQACGTREDVRAPSRYIRQSVTGAATTLPFCRATTAETTRNGSGRRGRARAWMAAPLPASRSPIRSATRRVRRLLAWRLSGRSAVYLDGARTVLGVAQGLSLAREMWSLSLDTIPRCPTGRRGSPRSARQRRRWFKTRLRQPVPDPASTANPAVASRSTSSH